MVKNVGRSGKAIDLRVKVLRPEEVKEVYDLIESINKEGRNNGNNGEVQIQKRVAGCKA